MPSDDNTACLVVSLGEQRLLNAPGRNIGPAVPIQASDDLYEIKLVSTDERHLAGGQVDQTQEQWLLELLGASGEVLGVTSPIGDLGDADTELAESVGTYDLSGVVAVRARHLGSGGVNSVVAARAVFERGTECLSTGAGGVCQSVSLGGVRLLNVGGADVGEPVEVNLPDGHYEIALVSVDEVHASGTQVSQTKEQWFLELLDRTGAVVGGTAPIGDLGEAASELVESVGVYDLAGVVAVRPRHLGQGGVNSVVAARAVFSSAATCAELDDAVGQGQNPGGGGGGHGSDDGADDDGSSDGDGGEADGSGGSDSSNSGSGDDSTDALFGGRHEVRVTEADSWQVVGPGVEVFIPSTLDVVPTTVVVDFELPPDGRLAPLAGQLIDPFSIEVEGLSGALATNIGMRFTLERLRGHAAGTANVVRSLRYDDVVGEWVPAAMLYDSSSATWTMSLDHLSIFTWLEDGVDRLLAAGDELLAAVGKIASTPECNGLGPRGEFESISTESDDVHGCVELRIGASGQPEVVIKIANRTRRTLAIDKIDEFGAASDTGLPTATLLAADPDRWFLPPGSTLTLFSSAHFADELAGIGGPLSDHGVTFGELAGELGLERDIVVSYTRTGMIYDVVMAVAFELLGVVVGKNAVLRDERVLAALWNCVAIETMLANAGLNIVITGDAQIDDYGIPFALVECLANPGVLEVLWESFSVKSLFGSRALLGRALTALSAALVGANLALSLNSISAGLLNPTEEYRVRWAARFSDGPGGNGRMDPSWVDRIIGFAVPYQPIMYVAEPGPYAGACPDSGGVLGAWCLAGQESSIVETALTLRRGDAGPGADRAVCLNVVVVKEDAAGIYLIPGSPQSASTADPDAICDQESPAVAKSFGDPHQLTFDRLRYSFQAEGEFILMKSTVDELEVQARHTFTSASGRASLVAELAIQTPAGQLVSMTNDRVFVDGAAVSGTTALEGGEIVDGVVSLDDGTRFQARERGPFMDVTVSLPASRSGRVVGLLGNANGDPDDDLQVRDDSGLIDRLPLGNVSGHQQLYEVFGPSWVPSAAERLLSGPPTSYRAPGVVQIGDFDEQRRQEAISLCQANGWTEANGLAECVFDFLVTSDPAAADPSGQFDLPSDVVEAGNAAALPGEDEQLVSNPGRATTSSGDVLEVEIASPESGLNTSSAQLAVSGLAGVGGTTSRASVVYVLDVSGSTSNFGGDCNGDGVVDVDDNLNPSGDSSFGRILDCEIAGLLALNQSVAASAADVEVSLVLLGTSGVIADVDPATDVQLVTGPASDRNENGTPDLSEVLTSIRSSGADLFTRASAGGSTNFARGLEAVGDVLADRPEGQPAFVYFLSDGRDSRSASLEAEVQALAEDGAVVTTFSVGAQAAGCDDASTLRFISERTAGTCVEVSDPSQLTAELTRSAAGLASVLLTLNDGAPLSATVNPFGQWQAQIDGLPIGRGILRATATSDDGTTASAEIVVYRLS